MHHENIQIHVYVVTFSRRIMSLLEEPTIEVNSQLNCDIGFMFEAEIVKKAHTEYCV
jgi:hypothetical protein